MSNELFYHGLSAPAVIRRHTPGAKAPFLRRARGPRRPKANALGYQPWVYLEASTTIRQTLLERCGAHPVAFGWAARGVEFKD
jgi:hypothetical protein